MDRAIEEPKIQTVLDEVRKLAIDTNNRETSIEEKVTYIKHQTSSNTSGSMRSSYSSILSQPSTASASSGGIPLLTQAPMPKHGQTPYNKDNKIVIKLQDVTVYKVLEEK